MKKLDNIEKKNPFKVPDNYFNDLSGIIKERVKQPIKIQKNYYWAKVAVAAVISVFIITTVVIYFNSQPENKTHQFSENSIVINFVDENTIVNEIIEDTLNAISDSYSQKNSESDDEDVEYVAESIDYESLLAEL